MYFKIPYLYSSSLNSGQIVARTIVTCFLINIFNIFMGYSFTFCMFALCNSNVVTWWELRVKFDRSHSPWDTRPISKIQGANCKN